MVNAGCYELMVFPCNTFLCKYLSILPIFCTIFLVFAANTTYLISVVTGNKKGQGTDAKVRISSFYYYWEFIDFISEDLIKQLFTKI